MENKETAPLVLEDIIGKTDESQIELKGEQKSVFLDDYDDDDDDDDDRNKLN